MNLYPYFLVKLCNYRYSKAKNECVVHLFQTNPGYWSLDDIRRTRGLKIAHLNIRSLRQKIDSIRLEGLDNKTIDILSLSETWLDDTIQDTEISLPGFVCTRRDRIGDKTGYGGVAVYVREGLPFRVRHDIDSGGNECLWIELRHQVSPDTNLLCLQSTGGEL